MAKANTRLPIMVYCTIVEITARPCFPSQNISLSSSAYCDIHISELPFNIFSRMRKYLYIVIIKIQ